jgi:hypothetical protein
MPSFSCLSCYLTLSGFPYFAICLFAGIRPDVLKGEIQKLATAPSTEKAVDLTAGMIRIRPEQSKVKSVRMIKISTVAGAEPPRRSGAGEVPRPSAGIRSDPLIAPS